MWRVLVIMIAFFPATPSWAQERTVRILSGFAAGGTGDLEQVARWGEVIRAARIRAE